MRDKLDNTDKDAEIQCLVWDGRLERDVGYEISKIHVNDSLVSFELIGRT